MSDVGDNGWKITAVLVAALGLAVTITNTVSGSSRSGGVLAQKVESHESRLKTVEGKLELDHDILIELRARLIRIESKLEREP
jgi:hypothetical protein